MIPRNLLTSGMSDSFGEGGVHPGGLLQHNYGPRVEHAQVSLAGWTPQRGVHHISMPPGFGGRSPLRRSGPSYAASNRPGRARIARRGALLPRRPKGAGGRVLGECMEGADDHSRRDVGDRHRAAPLAMT